MDLKQKLIEITAEDGPNIPLRTVAIYCGVSHATLSKFIHGKINMSPELQQQVVKGLKEMALQIYQIAWK